jgi:hypothetical protein
MSLFTFDLRPTSAIEPWGLPARPKLSWFALTLGEFRVCGDADGERALLFCDTDYQVAAHVRGVLATLAAAVAPMPSTFEALVADRARFNALYERSWAADGVIDSDLAYVAFRWFGERTPDFPETLAFMRLGDSMRIQDIEHPAIARQISPTSFEAECRDVGRRLLAKMSERIAAIESGKDKTRTPVSIDALRQEHEGWRAELESYESRAYVPDIPWDEAEAALRVIAERLAIELP